MRRAILAVMAAFALVGGAAACGEDDGDLRADVAEDIHADFGGAISEEDADCVAGELIDRLGSSEVRSMLEEQDADPGEIDLDAGFEDVDFDEAMEQMEAVTAAFSACDVDMFGGLGDFEDVPDVEDFDVDIDF